MDPFARPEAVERPKFFQSSSGDLVEVTESLIEACYTVKCLINGRGRMVFKNSLGGVFIYENQQVIHQKEQKIMATLLQNDAERLLVFVHDIRTPILRRLLDFVSYHQQNITERERKAFNATFIEECSQILCELASAAYYLDHKPLVNLTSKAIASQISGKTTEELREVLGTQNEPPMPASMTSHLRTHPLLLQDLHFPHSGSSHLLASLGTWQEISDFSPFFDTDCETLLGTHVCLDGADREIAARFRLQAKVDSKKQKQKLALMNGTATAPAAIEAPKATPEPDNRSVEDILAFLGEDTKPQNANAGKKGGKGKKSKGSAKQSSDANKTDTKPANATQDSTLTSSDSAVTAIDEIQDEEKVFEVEAPKRVDFEKETSSSPETFSSESPIGQEEEQDSPSEMQRLLKKSLNLSASSNTSSASATSSTTVSSAASNSALSTSPTLSIIDESQTTNKRAGAASNSAHLTFPSMVSHPSTAQHVNPIASGHSMGQSNPIQTPLSTSGQLPLFPSLPAFPTHHHTLNPINSAPLVVNAPHSMAAPAYQPIQNFFPTPVAQLPPGLDLPPGLNVMHFSGETAPLQSSGGIAGASLPIVPQQPSLYTYPVVTQQAAIHAPHQHAPQENSSRTMSHLLANPDSSFAMETSSFTLPPLTSSSSSAQYYWGLAGDEEDEERTPDDQSANGAFEDPDFELELAQFRQSLELGIRRPTSSAHNAKHAHYATHSSVAGGNAGSAQLRPQQSSAASNHSTATGNRPVGAY